MVEEGCRGRRFTESVFSLLRFLRVLFLERVFLRFLIGAAAADLCQFLRREGLALVFSFYLCLRSWCETLLYLNAQFLRISVGNGTNNFNSAEDFVEVAVIVGPHSQVLDGIYGFGDFEFGLVEEAGP